MTQPAPVAIIGLAVRVPGADDLLDFNNLARGERPRPVPPSRWSPTQYMGGENELGQHRMGRFITDPFSFDHTLFGLTREQAVRIDPQHRLMMETGRSALENAGLLGAPRNNTGVFVGSRMNSYGHDAASETPAPTRELGAAALWGRSQNFAAAWLSDRFDLTGPSMVVDTACSSSLTAAWMALQAIRSGECTTALVGGVDLLIDPLTFSLLSQSGAIAHDGQCKTFDAAADGYGPGEGAGAIVLKPLADAQRDGDPIWGLLLDARANNDGSTMGVTTPDVEAQTRLLDSVYSRIDPHRLWYIETHGTGTTIGDPIEAQALATVLTRHGVEQGKVGLSASKREVGHLHSAAGVVSLIQGVLSLRDRRIPTADLTTVNPRLRLENTPLYVATGHAEPLTDAAMDQQDAVGVSAFGFGGTNVHAVLARAPKPREQTHIDDTPATLVLSAPTNHQLRDLAAQWVELLDHSDPQRVTELLAQHARTRALLQQRLAVHAAPAAMASTLRERLLQDPSPVTGQVILGVSDTTSWIRQLSKATPGSAEQLEQIETAVGLPLEQFPVALTRLASVLVAGTSLAEKGVPTEAVRLSVGWEKAASYIWGGAPLHEVLPALVEAATLTPETQDPRAVIARCEAGEDPLNVVLSAVCHAAEANYPVTVDTRLQHTPAGMPAHLPSIPSSGPSLNLNEARRNPPPGTPTVAVDPTHPGGWSFTRTFSPGERQLAQHEVNGASMMPGVGWISFLQEGAAASNHAFTGLSNLLFDQPLMLTNPVMVRVDVEPDGRFQVVDPDGTRYVTGHYLNEAPAARTWDVPAALNTAEGLASGTGLYRWLRQLGYYHGRYFRNISWLAALPGGGTIARIEGERQHELYEDQADLSPGLLDSVTIAGIDPKNAYGNLDAAMFIPISIGQLHVHRPLTHACYVLTEEIFRSQETCRLNQRILDSDGTELMVLHEISSKRVPAGTFTTTALAAETKPGRRTPATRSITPSEDAPTPSTSDPAPSLIADLARIADLNPADCDVEFLDLGLDSVTLVDISARVEQELGVELYPTVMFEHPTLEAFAAHLTSLGASAVQPAPRPEQPSQHTHVQHSEDPNAPSRDNEQPAVIVDEADPVRPGDTQEAASTSSERPSWSVMTDIGSRRPQPDGRGEAAIIGLAVNLPTAQNLQQWWELLESGRCTITDPPLQRTNRRPDLTGKASYLPQVDLFDPAPFRISPREAPLIDPQARIAYETIWHALEDAGGARTDRVGLWVGYSHDHYHEERVRHGVATGRGLGLEAMVANRLSFLMDWTGPSMVVNTLCSSGLVALHHAVRSLEAGECDIAVVSGVHAGIGPEYMASMRDLGAVSPSEQARPFVHGADGFVPGEGSVCLVLQPRSHAERAGRRIRGLVRGSAINHNGRTTRYSAPAPGGQSEVIQAALAAAQVTPISITMLEAHGTGTAIGDPIEVEGLTTAWTTKGSTASQWCALGSVKANVGHLEPAAGLAGVAKVLAAFAHERIPPSLLDGRPNDLIRFEQTPFYLADRARPWPSSAEHPRRAAVSAFGMGGANAHVILQEPPARSRTTPEPEERLVRISGASATAVAQLAATTAEALRESPANRRAAVCNTLTAGRENQRFRAVVAATDDDTLIERLSTITTKTGIHRRPAAGNVAFLFSGQGSQRSGMGLRLLDNHPHFREAVEELDAALREHGAPTGVTQLWQLPDRELTRTDRAQIAIVALQVGVTRLLDSWGVRPAAVAGHSVGELTAAWASGVIDTSTLAELVLQRGNLMNEIPAGGGMAAVWADTETVQRAIAGTTLELAAVNAPELVTVAGTASDIDSFLRASGLRGQALPVSHAFHSAAMAPATTRFAETVDLMIRAGRIHQPQIGFASTATGDWHTHESVTTATVWADAIRHPVLFWPAVQNLQAAGHQILVEIGARPVLTPAAQPAAPETTWVPTLGRRGIAAKDETHSLHAALEELSPHTDPDWEQVVGDWHVADAPLYPFERSAFWVSKEI